MKAIQMPKLTEEQLSELSKAYQNTKDVRIRTRAQIVLLAVEQRLTVSCIATIVRQDAETVRRWLKRYIAQGIEGLRDQPRPGARRRFRVDADKARSRYPAGSCQV